MSFRYLEVSHGWLSRAEFAGRFRIDCAGGEEPLVPGFQQTTFADLQGGKSRPEVGQPVGISMPRPARSWSPNNGTASRPSIKGQPHQPAFTKNSLEVAILNALPTGQVSTAQPISRSQPRPAAARHVLSSPHRPRFLAGPAPTGRYVGRDGGRRPFTGLPSACRNCQLPVRHGLRASHHYCLRRPARHAGRLLHRPAHAASYALFNIRTWGQALRHVPRSTTSLLGRERPRRGFVDVRHERQPGATPGLGDPSPRSWGVALPSASSASSATICSSAPWQRPHRRL